MWATSRSTTSVVIVKVDAATTIATPVGASPPATTFTSVTMPATGATRDACRSFVWIAVTSRRALVTWLVALARPIFAWRVRARTPAVSASDTSVLAASRPMLAERRVFFAVARSAFTDAVPAVARTSPLATVSPTLTFTFVTGHVATRRRRGEVLRGAGGLRADPAEGEQDSADADRGERHDGDDLELHLSPLQGGPERPHERGARYPRAGP